MFRKIMSFMVAMLFVFCASLACAEMTEEEYNTQMDKLNDQMREARDTYKEKMKAEDQSILDEVRETKPTDKEARDKLIEQKREEKKQIQLEYRNTQEGLRAQVQQLKDQMKDKRKAGIEASKAKTAEKIAESKKARKK